MDVDRKDEATLHDVVTEDLLVPAVGALLTRWRVDRFPQVPGRMRLVSAPLWSLTVPTCEPELWLIIGKAAQRDEGEVASRRIVMHLPRRWSGAPKRGGVVACGVQGTLGRRGWRTTWSGFRR